MRQAVYCFDKAIVVDPLDVDALWDRSFLQKDLGEIDASMKGFQQILKILPYHFKVINEMAQLYRIKGKTRQAITLYEEAMEHHIEHAKPEADGTYDNDDDDNPFSDKLGYSEINMLSELYLMVNDYRRALDCIKTGIRYVQRRQHEVRWLNRPNDDDEYLPLAPARPARSTRQARYRASRLRRQQDNNHTDGSGGNSKRSRRNRMLEDDDDNSDGSFEPDSDDDADEEEINKLNDSDADLNDADDEGTWDEEASLERQNIPLELRVRMGVCRIYLGQADIADRHFEYLNAYSPIDYSDLYQDVACAYMERRRFDQALTVFQKILDSQDEVEMDILVRTADCYREVGDLETAMVFYINVLDEWPENLEVMTSLAMVYEEQGKEDEAFELMEYVLRQTREAREKKRQEAAAAAADKRGDGDDDNDGSAAGQDTEGRALQMAERLNSTRQGGSLFDEQEAKRHKKSERVLKREKRRRDEEERELNTQHLFARIHELHSMMPSGVVQTDRNLMREYVRVGQQLWDDFRTHSSFPKRVRN
jgi:tetratricopeptide (TPR) repeat protein